MNIKITCVNLFMVVAAVNRPIIFIEITHLKAYNVELKFKPFLTQFHWA